MTIEDFKENFFKLIEEANDIVITAHISPDDDAIASVLSTYTILTNKFSDKNIRIIYTGQKIDRYSIFYNFDKIQFVDDIANFVDGVDTLIILDLGNLDRTSLMPEVIEKIPTRICIDHHGSKPGEFTLSFIDTDYSSTSEIIYTIFDSQQYLDKPLAEIFLLGILGDTGNLSHIDRKKTYVFDIVKKLIEIIDVRIDTFLSRYNSIPKHVMPLIQEFVKNTAYVNIAGWPSLQYSFVSREFSNLGNYSDEDMSAASHIYMGQYLRRVEGQPWGLVFSPRSDGGVRMSARSLQGSVNVRIFNESLGVGGGHDRASGGNFKSTDETLVEVEGCIEKVLDFMKNNKPVLS